MADKDVEIVLRGSFKNGKLLINTTEQIDKNVKKLGNDAQKTSKNVSALERNLKRLAGIVGIGLLARSFSNLVKSSLQAAGSMEQVDIALTTMLGSAEKAAELQRELIEFAKKTPFEIEGIFQSTKQLLAYGVAQEDILDTMNMLGNIASGTGVEMSRLALVFGQVRSVGKLMGQDLNQFTQAGVPLLAELAKTLGITEAEVIKLKESGQISFEAVKAALAGMTSEGGRFFDLMQEQSKTFLGTVSNMADSFFQLKTSLGNALLPAAKVVVNSMISFFERLRVKVDQNRKQIEEFANDFVKFMTLIINNGFKPLLKLMGNFITGVKTLIAQPLIKWLGLATAAVVGLRVALLAISANPFIIFATAIITAIGWLVQNFDSFSTSVKLALLKATKPFLEFQKLVFITVDEILAKFALLSDVPGFGWTQDLSDSFNESANNIINDVDEINSKIAELETNRFADAAIGVTMGTEMQEPSLPEAEDQTQAVKQDLIAGEDPEKAEQKRLKALKEENAMLLNEQKAFLGGFQANQSEADQLLLQNKTLAREQELMGQGDFAEKKEALDQQLLNNEISLEEHKQELAALNNEVKLEVAQEQFDAELEQFQENQMLLDETKLEMQMTQDEAEQLQLQAKLNKQQIAQDQQNGRLLASKVKLEKQKALEETKADKFRKFMSSKEMQTAEAGASAMVKLQNSKNKEIAAIGKAAAIFQITMDTARGAMSAYSSLAMIPIVGPALGAVAAAAVIAYGAEQLSQVKSNSFAVGTPNIPQDQLATVHQGEMIVPATFSEAIRSGDLALSGGTNNITNNNEEMQPVITNINIDFDGAQFVGQMDDDEIIMIGERLGQAISENIVPPLPIKSE